MPNKFALSQQKEKVLYYSSNSTLKLYLNPLTNSKTKATITFLSEIYSYINYVAHADDETFVSFHKINFLQYS